MTERELARIYRKNVIENGGEPEFLALGFGPHSAYPHAKPGDRKLSEGDLVRFDVGCSFNNYSSDIARTYLYKSGNDRLKRIYAHLHEGMEKTMSLLESGADTSAVFDATLEFIREGDVIEEFERNHFGHGIGLNVYDPPIISNESDIIESNMVMCIEPPYYELGTGGIQMEDEVVVTQEGVQRLSHAPDTLPTIG